MKFGKSPEMNATHFSLQQTPVAIIGMASIFPQARNLQQYWDNIIREVDCITDVPPSRWNIEDYYDPDPNKPDKTYCKRGGFIPDIDFEPLEFGLPPNILEATDISQLLALVTAKEALEDAGYDKAQDAVLERTGITLGVAVGRQLGTPLGARMQYPIWERVLKNSGLSDKDTRHIVERIKAAYVGWQENSFPGALGNVVAGRVANRLNLGGTNCVVDAACASSLGAAKMAISELIERRCDMMIAGGVDTDNSIMMYMCFSKTPAFSQKENTRPFDADSDGMLIGEGIGMLTLKRLEDAERDNDKIYAVIRGVGTSSDGRYKSIYAPRPEGQMKALRRAYQDAGFSPATVGLIEAHGTGTMAGDPAEVEALKEVFGENNPGKQYIALGSVKSQIGHTKAAAGAASLIKATLALHHKVLPPTINITQPNPALKLENSPFYLNTKARPWFRVKEAPPRRAGVSSFGFGGTNFHIVLEEYAGTSPQPGRGLQTVPEPVLLAAPTPAQLLARCQDVLTRLQTGDGEEHYRELLEASKSQISFTPDTPPERGTRGTGGTGGDVAAIPVASARVGFVVESLTEVCEFLQITIDTLKSRYHEESWTHPRGIYYRQAGIIPDGKVVALFSGQGSQYLEMGRELACNLPLFREAYSDMDTLFIEDGWQPVSNVVFPPPVFNQAEREVQAEALRRTEYAQPAIGAFSAGLYKLMQQAGFKPDFVAGHSFGELTALWAAGVLEDKDYFALVKARGKAMASPDDLDFDAGAMLAVQGDIGQIQAEIAGFSVPRSGGVSDITIANLNANNQAVLAGATPAVKKVQQFLVDKGYSAVLLPVSAAFHTPLVGHAQQPFTQAIKAVTFNSPKIAVYANATGSLYPSDPKAIQDTLAEHILKPVLFKQQIENIYKAGGFCFIEFGPKNILTNLVKNILNGKPHLAVALNANSKKDSDRQLREALVQLRVIGLPLGDLDPSSGTFQSNLAPGNNSKVEDALRGVEKKSSLKVRLNGNNYISEKTQMTMEKALQDRYQITPSTPVPPVPRSGGINDGSNAPSEPESSSTLSTPPFEGPGRAGHPTSSVQRSGFSVQDSAFNPKPETQNPEPRTQNPPLPDQVTPPVATDQTPASPPATTPDTPHAPPATQRGVWGAGSQPELRSHPGLDYQHTLDNLERGLTQFMKDQHETVRVHEQYLNNQSEYAKIFFQLMQQQYDIFSKGIATPEQMETMRTVLENLGHSMLRFHDHQGETGRIHEEYLNNQAEYFKSFFQLLQQQYALFIPHTPFWGTGEGRAQATDGAVHQHPETIPAVAPTATLDTPPERGTRGIGGTGRQQDGSVTPPFGDVAVPAKPVAVPASAAAPVFRAGPDSNSDQAEVIPTAVLTSEHPPVPTGVKEEIAPEPPTIPSGEIGVNEITTTLLEVVSDKTGYPIEVLEPEMDMEADLGIDSIKRVEILGAMQELFPDLPQINPEELGELRTLGQIIDFIKVNIPANGNLNPVSETQIPAVTPVTMSAPAFDVEQGSREENSRGAREYPGGHLRQGSRGDTESNQADPVRATLSAVLLEVVSDKTGYPIEVLEPEMDMEADLGIDSIKRVEILGAMQELFPDLPQVNPEELGELRTLGQIIDFIKVNISANTPDTPPERGTRGTGGNLDPVSETQIPAVAPVTISAPAFDVEQGSREENSRGAREQGTRGDTESNQADPVRATLSAVLLEVVSDKTGYPIEVLELEMDMEADLGIDRVKRVEILGTVRDSLPSFPFGDALVSNFKPEVLSELRTLGQVIETMVEDALRGAAQIPPASPERSQRGDVEQVEDIDAPAGQEVEDALRGEDRETPAPTHNINRYLVSLKPLPEPDFLDFTLAEDHICLLTDDGSPLTINVAQALSSRGWTVVVLSFPSSIVANTPERAGQLPHPGGHLRLPEGVKRIVLEDMSEEHLKKQLSDISEAHGHVGVFMHLNPSSPVAPNEGLRFLEAEKAIVKHVFLMAKHLKNPLNEAALQGRSCFLTVARLDGQFGLGRSEMPSGVQVNFGVIGASLFGLTKTLNLEWPSVFCRAIDLSLELDTAGAAGSIIAELHDPNNDLIEVGYSSRGRATLVCEKTPPKAGGGAGERGGRGAGEQGHRQGEGVNREKRKIDRSSVFLVSGGAKGITAECVVKLAEYYQCKFILLGRSSIADPEPAWARGCFDEAALKRRIMADLNSGEGLERPGRGKPTPLSVQSAFKAIISKREVEKTLQAIEQAGGQAEYLSVDITDSSALRKKLADAVPSMGPITGIIHGAGNLADKWIEKKTEADFEMVYATKVKGLENLLQCVPVDQLDYLVLFSSTAGFYGNIGQADYAMANEVLNKAAHLIKQNRPSCNVVSINWGPWDGGMVTPALKKIFAMQNIEVIPIELGTQMFVEELSTDTPDTPDTPPEPGTRGTGGTDSHDVPQVVINSPITPGMLSPEVGYPGGYRKTDIELRAFRIHRKVTVEANPFLGDHMIGDQPVLPFTCAASWIINTCEHLNPGYKFFDWRGLKVLKGIIPNEIPGSELVLDLKEIARTHAGKIDLEATIWSENTQGKVRYHYQGQISLLWRVPAAPTYTPTPPSGGPGGAKPGLPLYQDGTLFHGPCFQGVDRVLNLSPERLTMQCILSEVEARKQGQFPVRLFNPYIIDAQLHSVLIWTQHFYQEGCLPSKLSHFEQFAAIPFGQPFYVSMEVQTKTRTVAVVNIIAHDAQGQVYNRLWGGEFRVSKRLNERFKQAAETHWGRS